MKPFAAAAICLFGMCIPAYAQPSALDVAIPCLAPHETMEAVTAAFETGGWSVVDALERYLDGLRAAAEPLLAAENLSRADTPESYDRHISNAHERAEWLLGDATVMERDGLFNVIEFHGQDLGGMIRCTIVGTDFAAADEVFASRSADVSGINGHEFIVSPVENGPWRSDVTWYRLAVPDGATAEPRGALAAIAVVHARY